MPCFRRFCLLILLLPWASLATGQTFFQKAYDLQEEENRGLAVLPDGHIFTAGVTQAAGGTTLLLQHLNEDGDLLWAKTYPVASSSQAADILLMNDGNLLVCWNGTPSGWMKVTPTGNIVWAKRLDGNFTNFYRLLALADGNYLLSGQRQGASGNDLDALAIKIDADGNRLWSNQFGTGNLDGLGGCYEDNNGVLHCAGSTGTTSANSYAGWLATLGPNGALIGPLRRFDSNGNDGLATVTNTTLDRLLLSGYSDGFGSGNVQLWLTEVDGGGAVRWSKTYDLNGLDLAPYDLLHLPGDEFLLVLNDISPGLDNPALLFKVDVSGDLVLLANRYRTNGEQDVLYRVQPTANGLAAVGSARRNGDFDAWVIKTTPTGDIPGCCPQAQNLTIQNVTPNVTTFVATEQTALAVFNLTNVTGVDVTPTVLTPCQLINTDFTLSADTVCPGECLQITLPDPTPGAVYSFSINGGEPDQNQAGRICYPQAGTFSITRQGILGLCSLSTTLPVVVTPTGSLQTPTAFSPDNDNVNDVFRLLFDCAPEPRGFLLRVYDRWGEILYEGVEPNEGWDGTVNGNPAPVDVYIWQAVIDEVTLHGEVTLLR